MEPLTQRQALDQLGQLPDRVTVASETKQQLDAAFGRRPPQLVEAGDLATGERPCRRRPRARRPARAPRARSTSSRASRSSACDAQLVQRRERCSTLLRSGGHRSAPARRPARSHRAASPAATTPVLSTRQRLAQVGHLDLERVRGITRELFPHSRSTRKSDDTVWPRRSRSATNTVRGKAATNRDHGGRTPNLQRPEDAELHWPARVPPLTRPAGGRWGLPTALWAPRLGAEDRRARI